MQFRTNRSDHAARRSDRRLDRTGLRWIAAVILAATVLGTGCDQSGEPAASTETPAAYATDDRAAEAPASGQLAAGQQARPSGEPGPIRPTLGDGRPSSSRPRDMPRDGLPIIVEPAAYDYGIISPGVEVGGTVTITNIGDAPITVAAVKPDCKCTSVSLKAGQVIAAGESVALSAVIDGREQPGPRRAAIRLIFEGYQPTRSAVFLGEIALPVRVAPGWCNAAGGDRSGMLEVDSLDTQPFLILASNGRPPVFEDGFDPDFDEPRNHYVIRWDIDEYLTKAGNCLPENPMPDYWVIETSHPDCPLVDAKVRHRCTMPKLDRTKKWKLKQKRVLLGEMRDGDSIETVVVVEGLGRDRIYSVTAETPNALVELIDTEEIDDEIHMRLRVTPKPGERGLLYAKARIFASLHDEPLVLIARMVD